MAGSRVLRTALAANMSTAHAMARSLSPANLVSQATEGQRKITAPMFASKGAQLIGHGRVWMPAHRYRLACEQRADKAWAQ
jgi:endonuclease G